MYKRLDLGTLLVYLLPWLALLGHGILWVGIFNRLHALAMPCHLIHRLEKVVLLILVGTPAAAIWYLAGEYPPERFWPPGGIAWMALLYAAACSVLTSVFLPLWLWRRIVPRPIGHLISNDTQHIDIARQLSSLPLQGRLTRLAARIPGNQILQLSIHDKTLVLPRLPESLDGFTIAHLSDLHFAGGIQRSYFERVIDYANRLDADLVAVTGDIVDKQACLDWIEPTLGRLQSRYGVYFILGNHDKRLPDVSQLRDRLTAAGLIDLGRQPCEIQIRGTPLLLAGNEMPWFGPPAELERGGPSGIADPHRPLRILLSHSPDQIAWARRNQIDLMLCGHTHGGQIRFPLIGPMVCPSRYGVRYAAGVFDESPVLMHVSRGISGLEPLRLNCPPELARLILRTADSALQDSGAPPRSCAEIITGTESSMAVKTY